MAQEIWIPRRSSQRKKRTAVPKMRRLLTVAGFMSMQASHYPLLPLALVQAKDMFKGLCIM
jgi:hypothetical protein